MDLPYLEIDFGLQAGTCDMQTASMQKYGLCFVKVARSCNFPVEETILQTEHISSTTLDTSTFTWKTKLCDHSSHV